MNEYFIKKLLSSETGATAIEYGLITALIVVAIISALTGMSNIFNSNLDQTTTSIVDAMNGN